MSERTENSGLIDLDALMKEAGESRQPAPLPERAPPTPPARVSTPAPAPAPAAAAGPARATRRYAGVAGLAAAALAVVVAVNVALAPRTGSEATASIATRAATPTATALPLAVAMPAPTIAALDPRALLVADEPAGADRPPHALAAATTTARAVALPAPARSGDTIAQVTAADVAAVSGENPADLGDAMRSAVGSRAESTHATESTTTSGVRQLRPSPGAVVGAINAVLPEARACLDRDAPLRSGELVFRSDGKVARVELRGSRTEDACVRTALSNARVDAFADDTFTTRVIVRP